MAACGSGGHKVYVQGAYKPKQVVLGAGTPIKDVRWLSYGGSTARAEGMLVLAVNCEPNCATGQTAMEPISFSVSYVGPCKGRRSYRLISMPEPTGSSTLVMPGRARTARAYCLTSSFAGRSMLSATMIAPGLSFG